ncbi:MAG: Coenzyme F420 hydrogenase/dehydrogenase, beta subunit C-terminal domain [Thermodesulfobacteriota bacterium]
MKRKIGWEPPIGKIKDILSAQTTNPTVGERCTDGGVVTSLLLYLLDHHMIDGALVSRSNGPFHRAPLLATTGEEIVSASGSHYDESYHIAELGAQYCTYSPAMYQLKELRKGMMERVAMVGTPCQIHTVRKMQVLKILPSDVIKYFFGLFCMENFSFSDLQMEQIQKKYEFDMNDIIKVNVKEDFFVLLKDGRVIHIPFDEIDSIARPACLACPDFSAEYSDISFGGLGSPEGYTTVLIRTDKGNWIYREALAAGYLRERRYPSIQKARSEWVNLHTKIINFSEKKRSRALKNRTERIRVVSISK